MKLFHVFDTLHPSVFHLLKTAKISPSEIGEHLHVAGLVSSVFFFKMVKNVPHSQAIA